MVSEDRKDRPWFWRRLGLFLQIWTESWQRGTRDCVEWIFWLYAPPVQCTESFSLLCDARRGTCRLLLQEKQHEVLKRCTNAEPRHGELWQSVSKDIANWKLKTKELLPLVSSKVSVAFWSSPLLFSITAEIRARCSTECQETMRSSVRLFVGV